MAVVVSMLLAMNCNRCCCCASSRPPAHAGHAGEPEAPDEALIGLLIKHEVVRRVTQVLL